MKKKPMARKWEDVRRDKRRKFLEDLFWSAGAVFFMVVGGIALGGAWLGL